MTKMTVFFLALTSSGWAISPVAVFARLEATQEAPAAVFRRKTRLEATAVVFSCLRQVKRPELQFFPRLGATLAVLF